ncbi:MAG: efflux RND transporter permease subunit [Verrucomicrobiales bacterium]|nr:efflux RND transporter permease subunit [Verrucomicrobiales bacterium]
MSTPPRPKSFVTHRPVAILVTFAAAVVFGFFSFQRLPVTLMPELTYPTLTVRTEYPGAAPQEVENEISRPIEEGLGVLGGLSRLTSVSRSGLSDVTLEFVWGTDMSKATQEALEKLDLVFLPREAERPLILRFDPALDPILELSLAGSGERYAEEQGLRRLRRIAELQIKRALEPLKGVAAVRIRGGLEEEYHVLLDKAAIDRTGLSIQTVIDRLRQENINVAGGTLKEGRTEYMVRALNEYEDLGEIAETVVARFDGREIRIKDIGRVIRSHKEREILTHTQGSESVQIDIYKEADANIVAVAKAVMAAVGEIKQPKEEGPKPWYAKFQPKPPEDNSPPRLAQRLKDQEGATLRVVADRSLFIEGSIREVRDAAISGGVLAVLILFLFLGDFKTTAIIGVSIPMSLLITFAPLHLLGVSLNVMSLGGLALGVGMLVDNSIVVLESIFRCREEGDDLLTAAVRGTAEVNGAVISSTLTTVAVFLPMVFVEGIAGQTFTDLSLAVVISLLASLAVALYFIPMLASRERPRFGPAAGAEGQTRHPLRTWSAWNAFRATWLGPAAARRRWALPWGVVQLLVGSILELAGKLLLALALAVAWVGARLLWPLLRALATLTLRPLARGVGAFSDWLHVAYPRWIRVLLAHPLPVLASVLLCSWLTWELGRRLGAELLPEVHQGEFTVEVDLPVGTPLEETIETLTPIEKAILADPADIEAVLVTFGFDATNIKRSDEGEHTARFKIILKPSSNPGATEDLVLQRLRQRFAQIPDATVRIVRPVLFSSQRPIVAEIQTDDLEALKELSSRALALLADRPELADVEATLRKGAPEIQVTYDRDRLALYALNIGTIARQVRDLVKGFEATRFNLKDRRIPILVRLAEQDRAQVEDVGRLVINPGADRPILLRAVADLAVGEGPSEIRRVDGQRVAVIQANVGRSSLADAVSMMETTLRRELRWPANSDLAFRGQSEEWNRSQGSLYLALGLSLFLVYVIMAAQFESLVQPLLIMISIPLAFFGSVVGLYLTGTPISVMVFLGLIVLAGIVVNNAIVLVDCANQYREKGLPAGEAIATAARVRLRPILLTTGTTVLGLLPMALGLGDGAEVRTPLALTVMFGLTSSTLLTLGVIPVVYHQVVLLQERWFKTATPDDALAAHTSS